MIIISNNKLTWDKIKVLHNNANNLMKKQGILTNDIQIKYRKLSTHKSTTKVFKTTKKTISNMEDKHRKITAEITDTLRKKDLLLKKVN